MNERHNNQTWERIDQLMRYTSHTQLAPFARLLGLKTPQNLYQLRNGDYGLTDRMANRILKALPEISYKWLMYGQGRMFADRSPGEPIQHPPGPETVTATTADPVMLSGEIRITVPFPFCTKPSHKARDPLVYKLILIPLDEQGGDGR